jgi:hypothetical protein
LGIEALNFDRRLFNNDVVGPPAAPVKLFDSRRFASGLGGPGRLFVAAVVAGLLVGLVSNWFVAFTKWSDFCSSKAFSRVWRFSFGKS